MWKKWLAFSGMLALLVMLDPTLTPAQPPGGKGGKGGKFGGKWGSRDGGSGPGAPGAPGGGPGFGRPREGGSGDRPVYTFGGKDSNSNPGGRPSFGGPQGGSDSRGPGGGMGGPPRRGGMSPDFGWRMLQGLTGSNGKDTVDLSKIPPERRAGLDSMVQRTGGLPLPTSGVWTKDDYAAFHAKSEEARASFSANGGSGNSMSNSPGFGFNRDRGDRDRGDRDDRDRMMGEWGGNFGGGQWGGNWGDRRQFEQKQVEEERPIAMRYGKLPQGLPGWYDELDNDKDGQVALYEWRKGQRDTKEFIEMDLNGDGLVTADEYLRFSRQKNIDVKLEAYEKGEREAGNWGLGEKLEASGDARGNTKGGNRRGFGPGSGGPKGDNGKGPSRGERGEKGERKGNPWSKRN